MTNYLELANLFYCETAGCSRTPVLGRCYCEECFKTFPSLRNSVDRAYDYYETEAPSKEPALDS